MVLPPPESSTHLRVLPSYRVVLPPHHSNTMVLSSQEVVWQPVLEYDHPISMDHHPVLPWYCNTIVPSSYVETWHHSIITTS